MAGAHVCRDGESPCSRKAHSKACQLRDRASDAREVLYHCYYDLQVTGNLEKAQQTCELWAQTYPRDMSAPRTLGVVIIPDAPANTKRSSKQPGKLSSSIRTFPSGITSLPSTIHSLTAWGKPRPLFSEPSDRKLEIPEFLVLTIRLSPF